MVQMTIPTGILPCPAPRHRLGEEPRVLDIHHANILRRVLWESGFVFTVLEAAVSAHTRFAILTAQGNMADTLLACLEQNSRWKMVQHITKDIYELILVAT